MNILKNKIVRDKIMGILSAILFLAALGAVNYFFFDENDNAIEEIQEEIIKDTFGVDVDLSEDDQA